ncbi:hypothetical protein BDZ97DRAFT_1783537 [Flammula alnicola]|nr:hypothetical protein BDZ97DRAFT_1783537 [Flammula alnicola]
MPMLLIEMEILPSRTSRLFRNFFDKHPNWFALESQLRDQGTLKFRVKRELEGLELRWCLCSIRNIAQAHSQRVEHRSRR